MTEISSNDRAFIKVSKELQCLRNDAAALEKLSHGFAYMNQSARDTFKAFRGDMVHSPEWAGLSKAIELLGAAGKMQEEIKKMRERITHLERLVEAYIKGQDIVATRLAQD
jgi:hypothetical protein